MLYASPFFPLVPIMMESLRGEDIQPLISAPPQRVQGNERRAAALS